MQHFQRINFDKWAAAWNDNSTKIESRVFHCKYLEKYFDMYKQRGNTTLTMMPIQRGHEELHKYLRESETGKEFDDLVGDVLPFSSPSAEGLWVGRWRR